MYWPGVRVVVSVKRMVDMPAPFAAGEISGHDRLARRGDDEGHPAPQNAQLCIEAKFCSSCGCGCTSDSTFELLLIDGHGTAADAGFPIAAKFVQAVRMLAASAS